MPGRCRSWKPPLPRPTRPWQSLRHSYCQPARFRNRIQPCPLDLLRAAGDGRQPLAAAAPASTSRPCSDRHTDTAAPHKPPSMHMWSESTRRWAAMNGLSHSFQTSDSKRCGFVQHVPSPLIVAGSPTALDKLGDAGNQGGPSRSRRSSMDYALCSWSPSSSQRFAVRPEGLPSPEPPRDRSRSSSPFPPATERPDGTRCNRPSLDDGDLASMRPSSNLGPGSRRLSMDKNAHSSPLQVNPPGLQIIVSPFHSLQAVYPPASTA